MLGAAGEAVRWVAAVGAAGLALVLWSAAAGADEVPASLSNRPPPVLTSVPRAQPEQVGGLLVDDASAVDAVPPPVGAVVEAVTELVGSLPPLPVLADAAPPPHPAPRPAATGRAGTDDDGGNGGTAGPVPLPAIGAVLGAEPPTSPLPLVAFVRPDGPRRPQPADTPPSNEDSSHSHRLDAFAAVVPVRCSSSLTSLGAVARSSGSPSAPPVVIAPLRSMSARSATTPLPPARGPPTDDAS